MATNEETLQKQVVDAFQRIGDVWGQARKGIIVAFNGQRVGTWVWNPGRLMIKAEDKNFKTLITDLQKSGLQVRQPVKVLGVAKDQGIESSVLSTIPLGSASPGTFDHALKLHGYYVIDLASATMK